MSKTVLILGGRGRIGQAIARDIIQYNQAQVIITGRRANYPENLAALPESVSYQALDLANRSALEAAIWSADLVIHCAGPFHQCDARVLELCLAAQVNYLDVSDHRSYVKKVIPYREAAQAAGVTAVLNTGIFPGVSNSMVRQGVESLDEVKTIHLSYVVAGSGGAGLTIMRTTFLGLQQPFTVWRDHCWQEVLPYSEREEIKFPSPFGQVGVYWFDVPEAFTFVESFPVQEIITKFGSVPEFYNYLTWATTRLLPSSWMKHPLIIEGLSRISYGMTQVTDRFTGEGVAIRVAIEGFKENQPVEFLSTMSHESTAIAAGCGAGNVAEQLLSGQLKQPGVWPVEQVFPTDTFVAGLQKRGIVINCSTQSRKG